MNANRILHVTDTFAPVVGGIETLVDGMTAAQRRSGLAPEILTRVPAGSTPAGSTPAAAAQEVTAAGVPVHRTADRDADLAALVGRADVVHVHVSAYSPLAVRAAVLAARSGVPVLATVHSVWGSGRGLLGAWARLMGAGGLPIQWAAVSSVAAEDVAAALRPTAPVLVVPNAIDMAAWRPNSAAAGAAPGTATGAAADPSRPVTVVSTLRMTRRKRPLPLLRMLRRVRADLPAEVGLRAVLVGDGPQRERAARYAAGHGMDWVELPGTRTAEQIRSLYAAADLYVAPAVMESFGLAALEARVAGLPVVAMARSGVADVLTQGRDALLVADDAAMTAALTALAGDPARRAAMAAFCRTTTPAADWEHVTRSVLAAYRQAAVLAGSYRGTPAGVPAAPHVLAA